MYNGISGLCSGIFAERYRYGGIREKVRAKFPRLAKCYEKLSPNIEHFIFGYAMTSLGYAAGDFLNFLHYTNPKAVKYANKNIFGGLFGVGIGLYDLIWEYNQNRERKEFAPSQFLSTVAGIATAAIINNSDLVHRVLDYLT
jgi:hypothetical protein